MNRQRKVGIMPAANTSVAVSKNGRKWESLFLAKGTLIGPGVEVQGALTFQIPVAPVGKARARTFTDKRGRSRTVTPKKTRQFEEIAALHAKAAMAKQRWAHVGVPVWVDIAIYSDKVLVSLSPTTRKRHGRYDGDNIEKAVLDALQKSGVVKNDRQVVACTWRFCE